MAAYAALLSVMYIIKQIEHHPRPPISLDKTQVESLTDKVIFLQEFLESYSLHVGYTKEADPLELRIADAAYAAEDVIESHIVDQIHAGSTSRREEISSLDFFEGLQKVINDMDLLKKEVMEIKEKIGGVQPQLVQRSSTPAASSGSSTAYAAEDVIESYIVDQIHAESTRCGEENVDLFEGLQSLELRIANAVYAAGDVTDVIESHIVDQILHPSTSLGKEISFIDLNECPQQVIDEMESLQIGYTKEADPLEQVIYEMETTKREVMEIKEKIGGVQHHLLQRSSNPAASFRSSSTGQNMTMVGFDNALTEVMDKLVRGQPDRQIIPIVGMGGIGKTTLARNVYKNPVVAQHFDVLAWATVSQEYRLTDILQELQEDGVDLSQMNECELGDKLHKRLSGRRYLIILDDIWYIQVWDQIRRFLPDNKNGSRIVITTRISDFQVVGSYVFRMGFLDKNSSWSLFSEFVFGEEEGCPVEMKEIGKKIVENCGGLPLSIVVVGGLLAKSRQSHEYWECIAENMNSVVNSEDDESCLKILHISYNQLPIYLKPCFLYMGVFPEYKKICVSKLIKQWVGEGFLKPISGKIWEEIAEEYLRELINRNLVLVNELGSTGNIKYCYIHDLLRDLCLREAQKQRFYNTIRQPSLNTPQDLSTQRRIVIPISASQEEIINAMQFASLARSLIFDSDEKLPLPDSRLLRIFSHQYLDNPHFLEFRLVNSRFILLCQGVHIFPSSLDLHWNLHTLILDGCVELETPFEIWNMSQLRHLKVRGGLHLQYPTGGGKVGGQDGIIMENLQMLGRIINFKCCKEVVKRIPNIKKLSASYYLSDGREMGINNFCHLQKLESLSFSWTGYWSPRKYDESCSLQNLSFPRSLKKLNLVDMCYYNWEDNLEKIGSLPYLEKLSLTGGCFKGKWETVEGHFPKLKFLRIQQCLDLKYWITESSHFPCLERLVLRSLDNLSEIPSEIGEIPTLESIKLDLCIDPIIFSAKKIQEEQEELYGEVGLQVRVETWRYRKNDLQRLAGPNFHISFLHSD